jgi:hypothetical protein
MRGARYVASTCLFARAEEILSASSRTQQSARFYTHIWRLSHNGIELDQKKGTQLPPLTTTLLTPAPEDPTSTTLKLDELWSFVLKKGYDFWIWIALCRKTRKVVAYAVGDRSKQTCLRLWESIPSTSSSRALLHRLLSVIFSSDPEGAARALWEKRQERPPMWSAGIIRCANVSLVLSA